MTTRLIITVDTEEEGLWSNSFRAIGNTVNNVQGIPAFQAICENHRLSPVYMVNTPVLEDDSATNILRAIHDRGNCEIGCHIHPWNTPPVEHHASSENSYLCNLNEDIQRIKIEQVTAAIENRFGIRPYSFRAGRYGLDTIGAKILHDQGYEVDSSVCPFTDYSEDGGPDFRGYPWSPYYIGQTLSSANLEPDGLLEVPVSFGFNWSQFESAFKFYELLASKPLKHLRLRGILSRLNLLNKIKFSPEKHDATQLNKLATIYVQQGCPSMVMMFHSSSVSPGNSPYVKNADELKKFLKTIDETIDHCLNNLNMLPATLSGFSREFRNGI